MKLKTLLAVGAVLASAIGMPSTALAGWPEGRVADVSIEIGPDLQAKADDYGEREFDILKEDLERAVARALRGRGETGGRLELVIVDAIPNRPTIEQMTDRPGLSMESFGVGGAEVEARYTAPDGTVEVGRYGWFDNDIRNARATTTWTDANTAFDRFARKLARGEL